MAELHLTLLPHLIIIYLYIYIYHTLAISISLPPQVKCENRWGVRRFSRAIQIYKYFFVIQEAEGQLDMSRQASNIIMTSRKKVNILQLARLLD